MVVGTRGHAKVTGLGVNGHHLAVGLGFDPSDVVANGGDFPAIEAFGWHQHGEVCFAASAGERSCHVVFFSLRIGHSQDEHVFGQPTLFASHAGRDAQGQALFAQQGIAAVARTVRPNFASFWVVNDVLDGRVARPRSGVFGAIHQRCTHGVQAGHKLAIGTNHIKNRFAHAGHELLVDSHVSAVCEFNADVGNV